MGAVAATAASGRTRRRAWTRKGGSLFWSCRRVSLSSAYAPDLVGRVIEVLRCWLHPCQADAAHDLVGRVTVRGCACVDEHSVCFVFVPVPTPAANLPVRRMASYRVTHRVMQLLSDRTSVTFWPVCLA